MKKAKSTEDRASQDCGSRVPWEWIWTRGGSCQTMCKTASTLHVSAGPKFWGLIQDAGWAVAVVNKLHLNKHKPLGSYLPLDQDLCCLSEAAPLALFLCKLNRVTEEAGGVRGTLGSRTEKDMSLGRVLGSYSSASHNQLAQHEDANSSCPGRPACLQG